MRDIELQEIFESILAQYPEGELTEEEEEELQTTTLQVYKALHTINSLFKAFREEDRKKYNEVRNTGIAHKEFPKLYNDLYCLSHGWPEASFIYLLNTYSDVDFRRRLMAFYYEFD